MAVNAFGTLFGIGDGASPEEFTTVANVHNISAPALSRDSIEVTSHTSTDGFREYIPGLIDGGEVSIEINWNPDESTHEELYTLMTTASANGNYQVLFPNDYAFVFSGHVTGFDASAPIDDRLTASVTFKVTGNPTLEEI